MNPVREALYDKLAGDATLSGMVSGVFHKYVEDDSEPPYVVFSKMSGVHAYAFAGDPLDFEVWLVKGVGPAGAADDIHLRCRAVLNRALLTIDGYDHKMLLLERDFDYAEVTDGETYHHVGGEYRLVVEESS